MRELHRTNNAIELSFILSQLRDCGIEPVALDQHTSAIEGSISAIQQRIMVHDDDYDRANRIMGDIKKDL